MRLRRGFKKEAEEYAAEFRTELGQPAHGPLDPFKLAEHLAIPVMGLSQLPDVDPEYKRFLMGEGASLFSATTIADSGFKLIIHNDEHGLARQNSNVMHEIAHVLLGHPLRPPFMEDNCRHFDPAAETEANQLGFTLLIPRRAALCIVESGMPAMVACATYGVSPSLLSYRIRITDAKRWAANRRRFFSAAE